MPAPWGWTEGKGRPAVKVQTPEKGRDVLVFMEQTDGVLEGVSLEVLGKAREIADRLEVSVIALLLGHEASGIADEVAKRGADVVLLADSPLLKDCTVEAYMKVLLPIITERNPAIVLIGGTHNGTTLAASLAVRLGAGLMAHVVDLDVDGDGDPLRFRPWLRRKHRRGLQVQEVAADGHGQAWNLQVAPSQRLGRRQSGAGRGQHH